MQFLNFVVTGTIQFYTIVLLLRVWIKLVKMDYYNPILRIIFKITETIINPINNIIPCNFNINIAILLFSYILTLFNILFILLITKTLKLFNITLFVIGFIQLLTYIGKLIFWLILIRIIFNLFIKNENKISYTLRQLTDPIIIKIHNLIPNIVKFDCSLVFSILILLMLNYIRFSLISYINPNLTNILYSIGYLT